MKAFFEKYPVELEESTALKMIHRVIEKAEEKCKKGDESYLKDAAKAKEMLEDFFDEIGIDPDSLI